MNLTRRTLTAAALAAAAAPAALAKDKPPAGPALKPLGNPLVIAHRGASGERPEHTILAYKLAIALGADFIEPDCVVSKDGHLVVRHENEIGGTTNIATRPEFAARKTTKTVDGQQVTGWFVEDFTLAELKTLRARERLPQLRAVSAAFNDQEPIVTYQEVVDLAKAESLRLGRVIGTYPEMKHSAYLASIGLPIEGRLLDALKKNGLNTPTSPVFVQCFEVKPLKTFHNIGGRAPRVMLVGSGPGPVDVKSAAGVKAIAAFAEGIGPELPLVVPVVDGALGPPSNLVKDAHANGLKVHPWTVRAENFFLPKALQRGANPSAQGDVDAMYRAMFAAGVDGLFSDFPGLCARVRASL